VTDPPGQSLSASHVQTEALFDVPAPPIRKGASDYLGHLAGLRYRDGIRPETWTFWALAPVERRWLKPEWVAQAEHVWLVYGRELYQALVDISSGEILRRRQYQGGD
jgi:hypothetical protein